jgi:O-antigen/teichoic acid export membrane protein
MPKAAAPPSRPASRTAKVLALSLGSTLSLAASLVYGMVAARLLSKHDYATIRQTFLAYDFVAPMLMLGLPNALYYFLPRDPEGQRGVVLDNLALLGAGAVVFSLFLGLGGAHLLALRFDNPDLVRTLGWLVPYPFLIMTVAGLAAVMVTQDRTRGLAIYNVLSSLLLVGASLAAVLITRSGSAVVVARIVATGVVCPVALWLMFRGVGGPWRWPRVGRMGGMLRYAVPLGLASMFGSLTLQLDSVIVAAMVPPENFAVYINGAMEIPLVGIITGSITTVVFAEMAELCHRGDKAAALNLFHKASLRSAAILFPAMCFLLVAAKPFILLLYSEKYAASVWPFMVYLCVLPVRIVVYGSAMMALGMTRAILFRSVLDLAINAILCVVLVRFMGYMGAAVAMVLMLYLWHVPFNLTKIGQGFEVGWQQVLPFGEILRILLICMVPLPLTAIVVYGFPALGSLGQLILAGSLYGSATLILLNRRGYLWVPQRLAKWVPFNPGRSNV